MQHRHRPNPTRFNQGVFTDHPLPILIEVHHGLGFMEIIRVSPSHEDVSRIYPAGWWNHDMGDIEIRCEGTHR